MCGRPLRLCIECESTPFLTIVSACLSKKIRFKRALHHSGYLRRQAMENNPWMQPRDQQVFLITGIMERPFDRGPPSSSLPTTPTTFITHYRRSCHLATNQLTFGRLQAPHNSRTVVWPLCQERAFPVDLPANRRGRTRGV